jgi:predicted esterase
MEQSFVSPLVRYYDVELPEKHGRKKSWPLLIALHGYEGDKTSMMRLASHIGARRMVVVSLQGPNQFFKRRDKREPTAFPLGFGWGTPYKMEDSIALHHCDLRTLIGLAARKYRASRSAVFLLGFSQACAYNYRFAFSHPGSIRGVVGVCGGVPGDWHENARYRTGATHVLHIAATRDQWYSREKNLSIQRQLAERAASLDFRFYDSVHRFPRASIPHIRKWIDEHR